MSTMRTEPQCRYNISVVSTPTTDASSIGGGHTTVGRKRLRERKRNSKRGKRVFSARSSQGGTPVSVAATPRTASGTPRTGSKSARNLFMVAVTEFRNHSHVGIAAINLIRPEVLLYQFSDNQTYANALMLLNNFDPEEILVPHTLYQRPLGLVIQDEFEMTKVSSLRRRFFNENDGIQFLRDLSLDTEVLENSGDLTDKYLCISALGCLMKYVQHIQGMHFPRHCLRFRFKSLDGRMRIDSATVRKLELIRCIMSKQLQRARGLRRSSLFDTINHCQTHMGARLLRSSILQPFNDLPTIELRLDTVGELMRSDVTFFNLMVALPKFVDLDHLNACLISIPKVETVKSAREAATNVLLLKRTLDTLPAVIEACSGCKSPLMLRIADNLGAEDAKYLRRELEKCILSDATIGKVGAGAGAEARKQVVFAIKPGLNGMLDVARKTYVEAVEEIKKEVANVREQCNSSGIKLAYSASRGYHLSLPSEVLQSSVSSEIFIQLVKRGKRVLATTETISSLNDRQEESFAEITLMTSRVLQELLANLRTRIGWLYNVAESIAFLDMMSSHARFILLQDDYCRPEFTVDGPIAIKNGRHCVVEAGSRTRLYVPNNTFLSADANLNIVTGPNNCGKTTYLLQVATITVLAHIGCHVPAEFASLRLTDQIFALMTTSDDIETNTSSFASEMRQLAYVLQAAHKKRCLVVMDELGRGTSTADGQGLCWATCEELMQRGAYTLFSSHFLKLTSLSLLYKNVSNVHFQVRATKTLGVEFGHKLTGGPSEESNSEYGIQIAKFAGFPATFVEDASAMATALYAKIHTDSKGVAQESKRKDTLVKFLRAIKHNNMDTKELHRYLVELHERYLGPLGGSDVLQDDPVEDNTAQGDEETRRQNAN